MNTDHYYYKIDNLDTNSYQDSLKIIKDIFNETEGNKNNKFLYYRFLNKISKRILQAGDLENKLTEKYFYSKTFEDLLKENEELFNELLPNNYLKSYFNPTYAVDEFGDQSGQLLSAFYCKYKQYIYLAYTHKILEMGKYNFLFINIFNYIKENEFNYEDLKKIIIDFEKKNLEKKYEFSLKENYDIGFLNYTDIVMSSNLEDIRYLFKYGKYITKNEIKTAEFLLNYPEDKIIELAGSIVKAYVNGFIRDNKDITKRHNVRIICNIGQERITRQIIKELKKYDLIGYITEASSTDLNKQFGYDHKFDNAIFLSEQYVELSNIIYQEQAKKLENILKDYSGVILIEKFGERPFSPENIKERLKLSEEQQKLIQLLRIQSRGTMEKYLPETETSFCIVAFPTPEIGENFEEIFIDIIKINMLDSSEYELIQQSIIDTLDKGDYVHVKGKGINQTDMRVKLFEIKDPEKETNFTNCVADVNIPVGEVFTTPVLKGTNGVLHVEEIYLGDFNYKDLKLTFKDGYVSDYICNNFEDEKSNKEYIKENLLFPYNTLPIGEFAIGTNTLAYVIAEKYNILDKLPILIIEKMGPHFAIGDTCFSWAEDTPVFNPLDKKEIISRDNEKSILRKKNVGEAYTNRHTDITLPYKSLGYINVITKNGEELEIIKDGRFTLLGTEELNKPFE
ncbi:MAG: aminopeptidase [Vulcanibacillus sp.]